MGPIIDKTGVTCYDQRMTSNERIAMYRLEFFSADDADDSDPDTAFECTGDNTDDLNVALAEHLSLPNDDDFRFVWIERDGDADRYNVVSVDTSESLGVAYVTIDYPIAGAK